MGTVFLAVRDDDAFQKRVALKILKRGMDTDAIVRRFRTERQILAGLDHPNIARLLDGGTTPDGLPYLVMEYVDGMPLDRVLPKRAALDTDARLELFLQLCAAVQYAHQNLVVHRDIKPANILVDRGRRAQAARLRHRQAAQPGAGRADAGADGGARLQLMTPEYASPEQVRGETVTTATDVYSLGVLLYELLTGRRPYRITSRASPTSRAWCARRSRSGRAVADPGPRARPTPTAPPPRGQAPGPARPTRSGCGAVSRAISTTSC